ncbi:CHASE2 domain-containing protein [Marinobacter bryozoorum]|uniref:CHASE2 domain-containing protein n=1 Tax=Marinobacter bryozoorum TaxID=256324 RepID=UPI00200451A6|nr:CHASE2 domain-containing protein [Marinobacter bryozoorum]MCK7544851.1 CHASE2 domain-containing protein [Marinobacter bryozoorum]
MTRDWFSTRHSAWTLALPLIGLLLLLQLSTLPQRLDNWLYDTLVTTFPPAPSEDVVIVAIDEDSLAAIGPWPWPRDVHARLIRNLTAAGVDRIVMDILFTEPGPDDAVLADAMKSHGKVTLPLYLAPGRQSDLFREQLPTPLLTAAAFALGHAHVELDSDGIARGLYLYNGLGNQLWPAMALAAGADQRVGQAQAFEQLQAPPFVNVRQDFRRVPLAGRSGAYTTLSYADLLEPSPATRWLEGKTVLVGATAAGFGDVLPTPFSGLAQPMSGVEFHANALAAARRDQLIAVAPGPWTFGLTSLCALLVILVLPRLRPSRTFSFSALVFTGILAATVTALMTLHLWIPAASAMLVPVIAFPLWSARRLSFANRFLNQQIDQLERGNLLHLPATWSRSPRQILANLKALLSPEGWLLIEDNAIVEQHNLAADDRHPGWQNPPGTWHHDQGISRVSLVRGENRYRLALRLPHGLAGAAAERYLGRLSLQAPSQAPIAVTRENLSTRINRAREATQKLNHIQQFIWRSFEHMPDGIIVTDPLGLILFANGHVPRWFNEPKPSLQGMPLAGLLQGHDPRSPGWEETLADTLTQQQSRTVDLHLHGRDFLIHFAPFLLPDSQQNGIIANISDISELREQQRQHREAIDFISHDVRSPLVSQLALIEQLKRRPGEVQVEQLDQLRKLARRSYHLAEEFVQLARAEQLTETRFYDCEFLAIVENARDSVSEQALEKNIKLVLLGNDDLWLRGNAELLERAVINLLTNAVQYSEPGTSVTMQVFRAGHQACLTVTDEGPGIASSELATLFDRFQRQKSSELAGKHGVGLGLSFVNVVVEKHKGEITVESREGEGSAFTLKLPVTNDE